MKIAQIAPLFERVPPASYGGTERIVSYVTEELVELGHDVVLFASGDSKTRARLVAPCSTPLRSEKEWPKIIAPYALMLEQVSSLADSFDILHFHTDLLHFPLTRRLQTPAVTTIHWKLDDQSLINVYREFDKEAVVSISRSQRAAAPWLNWQGNVYNGLPIELLDWRCRSGDYLAFLGRLTPEKRIDRALEIAKGTDMPLKVAAKIDYSDLDYFDKIVKPAIDHPLVEYVGEIGDDDKAEFLGNAYALLFPIDWPEPFGLVLIEALACGTPVIAFDSGSVSEIIDDGVTGYVVNTVEEAIAAVGRIPLLSRTDCRTAFENRFTSSRMVADYVNIYIGLIN